MKTSDLIKKLPVIVGSGSFLVLVILLLSTSPLSSSGVILVFFCFLLILLLSLVRILLDRQTIKYSTAKRLIVLGVAAISALMLKSAQSLNLLDLITLALIGFGLFFYASRRD